MFHLAHTPLSATLSRGRDCQVRLVQRSIGTTCTDSLSDYKASSRPGRPNRQVEQQPRAEAPDILAKLAHKVHNTSVYAITM